MTPSYFLAVDCGGTSTRAVITNSTGRIVGRAKAGSSNASDNGLPRAFDNIQKALDMALPSEITLYPIWPFQKTLLAMAGCDSVDAERQARAYAMARWKISSADSLVVTNDSALLASGFSFPPHQHCMTGVVLIAGTGSVAAAYSLAKDRSIQLLGRAGGYGYLLGDEGSAFWIGRETLRRLLYCNDHGTVTDAWRLHDEVLKHFDVPTITDLLPAVYAEEPKRGGADRKLRIASLGRLVQAFAFPLEARWPTKDPSALGGAPDHLALEVVKKAASELVQLALPLCQQHFASTKGVLVLGGGTMASAAFRQLVVDSMADAGLAWEAVEHVEHAADAAAEMLARQP